MEKRPNPSVVGSDKNKHNGAAGFNLTLQESVLVISPSNRVIPLRLSHLEKFTIIPSKRSLISWLARGLYFLPKLGLFLPVGTLQSPPKIHQGFSKHLSLSGWELYDISTGATGSII